MLRAGDKAPLDAVVWTTPRETRRSATSSTTGRVLLLFYLFDWSTT